METGKRKFFARLNALADARRIYLSSWELERYEAALKDFSDDECCDGLDNFYNFWGPRVFPSPGDIVLATKHDLFTQMEIAR